MDSPDSCRISVPGSTQVPSGRQIIFAYGTLTFFGWLFHTILLMICLVTSICRVLQPHHSKLRWFGLFPFRSPLLRESFLFLRVLRCFSSPGSRSFAYRFNKGTLLVRNSRFPYSEIPESKPVHGYSRLIAVTHVLHRHLAPRHSP